MKTKLIIAFAVACMAYAGCSSNRDNAAGRDANQIDTTRMNDTDSASYNRSSGGVDTTRRPDTIPMDTTRRNNM